VAFFLIDSSLFAIGLLNNWGWRSIYATTPEVLAEVLAVSLKELATKGDLKLLEASLRQQMAEMGQQMAEMRQQMAEMKTDLIKWVIGIALVQISLLVGILIKLL
jgi:hypothetical protein